MIPNEARRAIYDAFIAGWPGAFSPTVPYALGNEKLDPPDPPEYVLCEVHHSPNDQHTLAPIGSRVFDRRGLVVVRIFSAVDRGLRRLDDLATAACDIFEGKRLSSVSFFVATFREDGQVDGKNLGSVAVPFTYDQIK